jgi:carboxypeptidase C (cathepsin A)
LAPIHESWSFTEHENRYVEVAETLRKAIYANPSLKVFVANGYYDLATPFWATEYTLNHLSLETEFRPNIHIRYYEAGHMMYVHIPSLHQLKQDLEEFIQQSS